MIDLAAIDRKDLDRSLNLTKNNAMNIKSEK